MVAIDAVTTGFSGLKSSDRRLEVSALNIVRGVGALQNGDNTPYQPGLMQQGSSPAGTQAIILPVDPATMPLFDIAREAPMEAIEQISAGKAYEANLSVIKTGEDLERHTIDILT